MQLILLEKISGLGEAGEEVGVRAGYGRNYLVPYGKALPATEENHRWFKKQRAVLEKEAQSRLEEAEQRAAQLAALEEIRLEAQVSPEGSMYGSIGAREISQCVQEEAHITLDKNEIRLPHGKLDTLGEHQVDLELGGAIRLKLRINIVAAQTQ